MKKEKLKTIIKLVPRMFLLLTALLLVLLLTLLNLLSL